MVNPVMNQKWRGQIEFHLSPTKDLADGLGADHGVVDDDDPLGAKIKYPLVKSGFALVACQVMGTCPSRSARYRPHPRVCKDRFHDPLRWFHARAAGSQPEFAGNIKLSALFRGEKYP